MLSKNAFKKIQKCYGHFSSWAVWDPKDISNVDMLDPVNFDLISSKLKPEIVLVGLNLSAPIGDQPFANFHKYAKGKQAGGSANSIHKLRKSLTSSPAYGGYLTDIIKYKNTKNDLFINASSQVVTKAVDASQAVLDYNLKWFHSELADLEVENKLIITLGGPANEYIEKYQKKYSSSSFNIINIPHYSDPKWNTHSKYVQHVKMKLSGM